ncbi:hypothetical protein OCU04_008996 [Sclerotinia nivalis]|uniref:Uncharacterized protein n=1 Tax=Sclerotinia nivalis TaxID=352851 RepID=A0A9X0DI32_9HELO|nr:hypothetical protein OCU04_008996 [Sclerotinia nivalis]
MQLLPFLRQQKISPLAGGFLTGIFTQSTGVAGTRFEDGNPTGDFFKKMYDNEPTHAAMKEPVSFIQPSR